MTENEVMLFGVLGGIGFTFGLIWGGVTCVKKMGFPVVIFAAPIAPVVVAQMLFIIEGGIGTMLLLPGLFIAIGGPAVLSAGIVFILHRKLFNKTRPNQPAQVNPCKPPEIPRIT